MITFVDKTKVRRRERGWGKCYLKAGFEPARCLLHEGAEKKRCAACRSETEAGLLALQLLPDAMPEALAPHGVPYVDPWENVELFAEVP